MNIVLYQPQIPQNTGNVVRTCAVTGCRLFLVTPLGFKTDDRWLKRAGLDYWEGVNVQEMEEKEFERFLEETSHPFYFFSSKVKRSYDQVAYDEETTLIFGSETSGLPQKYFEKYEDRFVTLPMRKDTRCLNLATSVGIGVYEALRQQGFKNFR